MWHEVWGGTVEVTNLFIDERFMHLSIVSHTSLAGQTINNIYSGYEVHIIYGQTNSASYLIDT